MITLEVSSEIPPKKSRDSSLVTALETFSGIRLIISFTASLKAPFAIVSTIPLRHLFVFFWDFLEKKKNLQPFLKKFLEYF